MNSRHYGLLIFLALLFFELPGTLLFEPDEPRYAEIPREMLVSGDFVTPTLNGTVYIEKPPLLYWLNALSMAYFGETPYAARLTVRLAGVFTLLLLIFMLPKQAGVGWGLWSSLIYMSSLLPFALHRINIIDGLLTSVLALALLSLFRITQEPHRKLFHILLGLGLAGSVLSKGLIGLVLPGLVVGAWIVSCRRWDLVKPLVISPAWPIFIVLTAPWFIAVQKNNPEFFRFFFIHEHFQRYTTTIHQRYEPGWFFMVTFLWAIFPWTLLFFKRAFSEGRQWVRDHENLFFVLWTIIPIVFFSFSHSKLIPYILPALPGMAVLLGRSCQRQTPKGIGVMLGFWAACLLIIVFLLPRKSKEYTSEVLIRMAMDKGASIVVNFETFARAAPWTLKKPVPLVGVEYKQEMLSVGSPDSAIFWTRDYFLTVWEREKNVFALVDHHKSDEFMALVQGTHVSELFPDIPNRRYRIFSNHPNK